MFRRGIFGGSFDPPHVGHLIIAEKLADAIPLDIVTWVPAALPPHKNTEKLGPAEHRLAMTRIAVEGNPKFEVSTVEMTPEQPPWTIFLLEYYKNKYPHDKLHLIIGGDSLAEFTTWRDYRALWELAEIDVALRPGYAVSEVDPEVLRNIRIIECPLIDISATAIRGNVRAGKSIRYLVPEGVAEYIEKNGLYI